MLQGKKYVSTSKKVIDEKKFVPVSSCCEKKCFSKVIENHQKALFDSFWECGEYVGQNLILSGLIKLKIQEDKATKRCDWNYYYCHPVYDIRVSICLNFLSTLIQIGHSRFKTVQKKLKENESLQDKRGKHKTHTLKVTEECKKLIREHCESFSHTQSHYSPEKNKSRTEYVKIV